jgi:hypothetical protein
MAQVTGGTVSVEDGLKKQEEYAPPRKVQVILTFAVAEGEDYQSVFDAVSHAATNRVHSLLHGKPLVSTVAQEPAAGEATPPKRKRRTAAEIAAAGASPIGSDGGAQTSDEDPTNNEENVIHLPDEGAVEDETFDIEPAAEAAAEESFDIEPEPAAGEEITDADLNSAVQKKNAEIANPNAIRALIGGYNPDPKQAFQLRQIPAAKRAEFLSKLNALTKAA